MQQAVYVVVCVATLRSSKGTGSRQIAKKNVAQDETWKIKRILLIPSEMQLTSFTWLDVNGGC